MIKFICRLKRCREDLTCKYVALTAAVFFIISAAESSAAPLKYLFLFIGDGMGFTQLETAEAYLAGMSEVERIPHRGLVFNEFPTRGAVATDSLSGVTDSAAAATAISTGHSTVNKAIAMNPETGEVFHSVFDDARARGMKTGIVTSAFIQDATPAAFYAHAANRTSHYDIGLQLPDSGIDFFGGAGFRNPRGRDRKSVSLYEKAREGGYRIIDTENGVNALDSSNIKGRLMAVHPNLSGGAMPFAIDETRNGLRLAAFTRAAIEAMDGPGGFMLVVEGGLIDVACHANDAASCVREILDFDEAVSVAVSFMADHPDETLIVVTADHETGGMSAQNIVPSAVYSALSAQIGSYAVFEKRVSLGSGAHIENYLNDAEEFFGSAIDADDDIITAFRHSMTQRRERPSKDREYKKRYGPYDPFTVSCIRKLNTEIGITWSTFYHTGKNVPLMAFGAYHELFSGNMKNTDFNARIRSVLSDNKR